MIQTCHYRLGLRATGLAGSVVHHRWSSLNVGRCCVCQYETLDRKDVGPDEPPILCEECYKLYRESFTKWIDK